MSEAMPRRPVHGINSHSIRPRPLTCRLVLSFELVTNRSVVGSVLTELRYYTCYNCPSSCPADVLSLVHLFDARRRLVVTFLCVNPSSFVACCLPSLFEIWSAKQSIRNVESSSRP